MISIITINYKTADYVEKMLASLQEVDPACEYEVFVVENGSGDDLSDLEKRFPNVNFLYSEKNLGFAGGCNLAIEQASGDYHLLINPDIIFESDAVCGIKQRMDDHPEVAVGGARLEHLDGTLQKSVRRFPQPIDQLALLLKLPHVFPNLKVMKRWRASDFDYSKTKDIDQVMGAFFCIRQDAWEDIGPLDDGYFVWYEEVDFCKRAVENGWKVRYFADVTAKHKKGSSFERVATMQKQKILRNSIRRYAKKHFGFGWWLLFVVLEPLFWVLALMASIIKPK
jgi:hypothetical protein